jgi:hypothetical protein
MRIERGSRRGEADKGQLRLAFDPRLMLQFRGSAAHWPARARRLIKIGPKVASRGRYVTFQMTDVAVSRQMSGGMMMPVARLRVPPALA